MVQQALEKNNKNMYIRKGVKVIVNPSQDYFDDYQEWISETERWNYRRGEYKMWKSTYDNFWMYMAIDEETNEVISTCSLAEFHLVHSDEPMYTIGNYYCVPDWRGKGVSNKLFNMAIAQAGTHNIGLFGASQMVSLYASRFNFNIMNDFWHNFGEIDIADLVIPPQSDAFTIRKIDENDWQKLHEYDEQICSVARRRYMRASLGDVQTISRICQNSAGRIVGFGAIKKVFDDEIYLSPLYADTFEAAVSIVSALLKALPDLQKYSSLITIYPEINNNIPRMMNLISNRRFKFHSDYRNQYTQKMIQFPMERVWACEELSHSHV